MLGKYSHPSRKYLSEVLVELTACDSLVRSVGSKRDHKKGVGMKESNINVGAKQSIQS